MTLPYSYRALCNITNRNFMGRCNFTYLVKVTPAVILHSVHKNRACNFRSCNFMNSCNIR